MIGFILAPRDYRDWQHAPYYRRLYYSYKYFFAVSQPARNEHDGAILAGTMGLIRLALDELGGWGEWCIAEDADRPLPARPGEWVRYSSPGPDGAEYIAVCLPAFSPDAVRRDG